MSIGVVDKVRYGRELRKMRRTGIPPAIAKRAARESAMSVMTLPELTNPLGLLWIRNHGNRGFQRSVA